MAIEQSELQLVWPPAIFAREAQALLDAHADDDALAGLLAEAFHDRRGEGLLDQLARIERQNNAADDPWVTGDHSARMPKAYASQATVQLVTKLSREADDLPRYAPRPLYRRRQEQREGATAPTVDLNKGFAKMVEQLTNLGYFEDAFGSQCSDSGDSPDDEGQRRLAERLETNHVQLWPIRVTESIFGGARAVPDEWPDHVLFDVIEALDELVARPRQRHWHGHHEEWDYSDYSRPAGKLVYRWKVNSVLERSGATLRLAESGEDAGLLVTSPTDARANLVEQVLETAEPKIQDLVTHAVAVFRRRDATPFDKRTACKYLADVLEARRTLLKENLLTKDEGALFQIANSYEIRHLNERQKSDYDPAFLDWVFWWYLGTIELTNKLLERSTD